MIACILFKTEKNSSMIKKKNVFLRGVWWNIYSRNVSAILVYKMAY